MPRPLSAPERRTVESLGELIKFWGFSKHHGRIWTLLYLREAPQCSGDIQDLLQMSAGLVSMSVKELLHWEVIAKVWIEGDRRDYFAANTDLWRMVTRVIREREAHLLEGTRRSLDDALGDLETTMPDENLSEDEIAYMAPRLQHLITLIERFSTFLTLVLNQSEVDLFDLRKIMSNPPSTEG
jgi:DNA-binding transcriptional regulator GbsR (MarR family)